MTGWLLLRHLFIVLHFGTSWLNGMHCLVLVIVTSSSLSGAIAGLTAT
jgi:hypothetical protein